MLGEAEPEERWKGVLWRDWSVSLLAEVTGVGWGRNGHRQRGGRGTQLHHSALPPGDWAGGLWETELVLMCLERDAGGGR